MCSASLRSAGHSCRRRSCFCFCLCLCLCLCCCCCCVRSATFAQSSRATQIRVQVQQQFEVRAASCELRTSAHGRRSSKQAAEVPRPLRGRAMRSSANASHCLVARSALLNGVVASDAGEEPTWLQLRLRLPASGSGSGSGLAPGRDCCATATAATATATTASARLILRH